MVARWAVIRDEDNAVVNMIEWDGVSLWTPPDEHYAVAIGDQWCNTDYIYDPGTGTFTPPAP
jgi:hypothetical protein